MATGDPNSEMRFSNAPGAWKVDGPCRANEGHPVLATPTARLRALLPEDRVRLVEILSQHLCINATIDEPHALNADGARRWIDARVAEEKMGYALHWAICLLSNDELIGYVGLHDIDLERRHAELCFWLEPFPSSGEVMLEAAQTALAFAFANLKMSSMRAVSAAEAEAAAGLLGRIGMQLLPPVRAKGSHWTRFTDVNIWTLTRRRWEQRLWISRHN